eukprot:4262641-Amphidinium_carterae.1
MSNGAHASFVTVIVSLQDDLGDRGCYVKTIRTNRKSEFMVQVAVDRSTTCQQLVDATVTPLGRHYFRPTSLTSLVTHEEQSPDTLVIDVRMDEDKRIRLAGELTITCGCVVS